MRTDLFDYELPPEQIAQFPVPRGESRLLVLHRNDARIEHRRFPDLLDYLRAGDTLALNDTRVTARRLEARRESGRPAEVFLLRPVGERGWEALVRPGKSLLPGKTVALVASDTGEEILAGITAVTEAGGRILELPDTLSRDRLASWGVTPLPPYIRQALPPDQEARYQTVYAQQGGSAAAPTAGLHFTPELLAETRARGIGQVTMTLNIGIDTFRPVKTEEIEAHEMHGETVSLSAAAAGALNATRGRIVCVGTTCVRTLESAALRSIETGTAGKSRVAPFTGETRLFITPGYHFRAVDALLTNFHLPRSTLLMLVSAFAGRELVLRAYGEAVREGYRFFSFGDAMLIL